MQELSEDILLVCPICDETDIQPNYFYIHVASRNHLDQLPLHYEYSKERRYKFSKVRMDETMR